MNEIKFYEILLDLSSGRAVKQVASTHSFSERMVRYVKEARTWERWPYILAKARCGYQTPEYYGYLRRRGLPKTPPKLPPKDTMVIPTEFMHKMPRHEGTFVGHAIYNKTTEHKRPGFFARLLGRK